MYDGNLYSKDVSPTLIDSYLLIIQFTSIYSKVKGSNEEKSLHIAVFAFSSKLDPDVNDIH